jgi:nucleoid-associated protein YgaU
LWLTYLNYDQRIQQAVRRLGALSTQNVDVFRALLLKDRDRSRVKEYEAESIRRLQGEAFVGDEELQRTLIVLTAENPRYGEELKRRVAATGKPAQLDQAVVAIRSGQASPVEQAPAAAKQPPQELAKETVSEIVKRPAKEPIKDVAKEPVQTAPPVAPKTAAVTESAKDAVVVPLHKERTASAPQVKRDEEEKSSGRMKRVAVIGAVVLVAGAGLAFLLPGLIGGDKPSVHQAAVTASPLPPQAVAPSAAPAVPHTPAPAVDIAMPDQADKEASPPLRPASAQPDAPVSDAAAPPPDLRSEPVMGSHYKVVRGDMLSDIALKVYHDASKFRLIQSANPGIRNSPDRILVDQVIFIPEVSGSTP